MVRAATLAAICSLICSPVSAQTCDSLKTNVAQIESIGAVVAKAKALNLKKGEFESRAAFSARASAAGRPVFDHEITVAWRQADLTTFDPDSGKVIVGRYAVNSTCSIFVSAIPSEVRAVQIGPEPKYDWQKKDNAYCLSKPTGSVKTGSYIGSNAYGATRSVSMFRDREEGILIGFGLIGQEIFPTKVFDGVNSSPWLEADATPEEAKSLKQNAVLLISLLPATPFYAEGRNYYEASFDSPTEVVIRKDFLIGTPTCIALADRLTGKIFATRPFVIAED